MKKILLSLALGATFLSFANPKDSLSNTKRVEPLPDQLFLIIDSTYTNDRPGQMWDLNSQNCFFQIENGQFMMSYRLRNKMKSYWGNTSYIKSRVDNGKTLHRLRGNTKAAYARGGCVVEIQKLDKNNYVITESRFREPVRVLYARTSTTEEKMDVVNFYK